MEIVCVTIQSMKKKAAGVFTNWIDVIDPFTSLFALSAYPMAVKVGADTIEHLGWKLV